MYQRVGDCLNPLNAELNPLCHLLALLGAHHIFHVSGVRVKLVINRANVSTCRGLPFNPIHAELNPICHLLALLGARHIFHVCRIRVKNDKLVSPVSCSDLPTSFYEPGDLTYGTPYLIQNDAM